MAKNNKIGIIDYGVGNLFGLNKAISKFAKNVVITEDPEEVNSLNALILPGVGSFEAGINGLKVRNLINPVKKFAESGKPMLGICLGAQLLLSKGYEFGNFDGLDIIPGKVVLLSGLDRSAKVPHIGWNRIEPVKKSSWRGTILDSVKTGGYVYFIHSFVLQPDEKKDIFSLTSYGGKTFCSMVKRGNIYGCQFHPEKSATEGLKIIKNFVSLVNSKL